MTPEQIHDALTLLPGDLIVPVDKLRTSPPRRTLRWVRWVPLAACLALMVYSGFWLRSGYLKSAAPEAAQAPAESPAAAAPKLEMAPAAPAADTFGTLTVEEAAPEETAAQTNRSHSTAEIAAVVIHTGDLSVPLAQEDAVLLLDILDSLEYTENTDCMVEAEFTVDTRLIPGIQISLTEGCVHSELGHAELSGEQMAVIQDILAKIG